MVRSRLVVGSSAMSSRGSHEIAMAPTMRWRMPPDIWCGYSRNRGSPGPGSAPTAAASLRPRPARSGARRARGRGAARPPGRPTVKSGFSEAIGSCRIIAMRLPRIRRISPVGLGQEVLALEADLAARRCGPRRAAGAGWSARGCSCPSRTRPRCRASRPPRSVSETSSTARTTRVPRPRSRSAVETACRSSRSGRQSLTAGGAGGRASRGASHRGGWRTGPSA